MFINRNTVRPISVVVSTVIDPETEEEIESTIVTDLDTNQVIELEAKDIRELSDAQATYIPTLAQIENAWASEEISWAMREICKHENGCARTTSSIALLRAYCNQCYDIVIDGSVVNERPTNRPE